MTTTDSPVAPARQRAFASDVGFSIGVMTVQLDVVSQGLPNAKAATTFSLACPVDGAPVRQHYRCEDDHTNPDGTPFTEADLHRARVVDGQRHAVTSDQIKEVTSSGRVGAVEFRVHPAAQVEAATRHGGSGYRLRPPKKSSPQVAQVYAVLLHLAQRSDLAIIGEMELPRTGPKLYRLSHFHDQLMLDELVRPDELAPVDDVDASAAPELLAMAEKLAETLVADFDAGDYRNTARDRAAALDERLRNGETVEPGGEAAPAGPASDLMAALAASLEAAKPVTPPRKPRKRAAKKAAAAKPAAPRAARKES